MSFHLAIIPDGNRRWAKQNGVKGYKVLYDRGVQGMLGITQAAFDSGVTHLSLWGSSHANIADRSGDFYININRVFRDNIHEFANHPAIEQYDVHIDIIGEWRDSMAPDTVAAMEDAIAKTAHRTGRRLTILIDYSGDRERAAAFVAASQDGTKVSSIDDANTVLRSYSWTNELPPLDLIIRTGSWIDPHNSAGFMSLLADETQYAFPKVLWPDFTPEIMLKIINDFKTRERRHGK
jgi:undecaprenyl diphosphate synthase